MPTFEPVAWQTTRNGFICKENKNPEYNIGLFTESQLQQVYEAGLRDAVPEGFTLVPIEPTVEMLDATGAIYDDIKEMTVASYKAMLAAAPKGDKE